MDNNAQVAEVITFFRSAFSLIFALALAEAFKQFISDRAKQPTDPIIDWDRLLPLLSFVLLIFPFYQGTIRYFVFTYGDPKALPQPYSFSILFDSGAFMIEVALFFVMSRALAPLHWQTYYGSVLTLLWVDSIWGLVTARLHKTAIEPWIYLNLGFGAIVALMLFQHKRLRENRATIIGFIVVLLRTGLDYYTAWEFYFP